VGVRGQGVGLALAIGLLAGTVCATDPPELQIGPYLQSVLQDSAVVMWHSATAAAGRVEFGEGEVLDHQAVETEPGRVHEVRLTGLKPGRRYRYRVGWDNYSSDVYSFRTAPPASVRRFRFALYGDNRTQPEIHRQIVARMLKERPDLVLNAGDLVAAGRQVEQWEPMFFGPLRPLMREISYWPSLGNHEQNAGSYYHFFSLPNNEAWYSFDYANAHLIALDSNQPYAPGSPQYEWLEEDLQHARADWKIVFFHHPMFSAHPTRAVNANRWAWEPLFLQYGVNLVLTGHDHHYQRCYPVGTAKGDRMTYHFTSGGGGAPLYPVQQKIWTAVTESVHHFMLFDIEERKARGKTITVDGKQIDQFTIDLDRRPAHHKYVAWEPFLWERSLEEQLRAAGPQTVRAGPFRVPVRLSLENPLPRGIRAEMVWESASGWQSEPAQVRVSLAPQGREDVTFIASARWPECYPVPAAVLRLQKGAERFRNRELRLAPLQIRPERELTVSEGEAPLLKSEMVDPMGRQRREDIALEVHRTSTGLEFRVQVPQSNPKTLSAGATERDSPQVWNRDEGVLLRLVLPGGVRYDLGVNSRGTQYDTRGGDTSWNGAWTATVEPAAGGWAATLRIPWSDLALGAAPGSGSEWRWNVVRTDGDRRETSEWVPTFGDTNAAASFGRLRL
jgi:hypothetical protein